MPKRVETSNHLKSSSMPTECFIFQQIASGKCQHLYTTQDEELAEGRFD